MFEIPISELELWLTIVGATGGGFFALLKYVVNKFQCIAKQDKKLNLLYTILKLHLNNRDSNPPIDFSEFDKYFED